MDNGNKTLCQGKDVFERMNFLFQASQAIVSKDVYLSSFYGDTLIKCSKKAVLRLGTDIKRSICKVCQSSLIPGETASVRLKSKPFKCIQWRCLICNNIKKYPCKKGYKLWFDNVQSTVQEYNYGDKVHNKNDVKTEIKNSISVSEQNEEKESKLEANNI